MDLDATALRVLGALVEDGRAGPRDVAAATDVSVPRVVDAIDRLETAGIVEGYEPRLDYAALGYGTTAVAHLRIEGEAIDAVVDRLADDDRVRAVYEVTGDADAFVVVTVRDREALEEWVGSVVVDPAVRSLSTDLVTDVAHEGRPFAPEGG